MHSPLVSDLHVSRTVTAGAFVGDVVGVFVGGVVGVFFISVGTETFVLVAWICVGEVVLRAVLVTLGWLG